MGQGVGKERKSGQLQVRVSPAQKRAIRRRARAAGMSMSDWVLSQLLPAAEAAFQDRVDELARSDAPGLVFAELLELFERLGAREFEQAVASPPRAKLDAYWQNYLAATVEHTAARKKRPAPPWVKDVPPLEEPVFGSSLKSLRLHLLSHSPPAFSRRNIFIDASVGDRV